jgi:hypothetical protein
MVKPTDYAKEQNVSRQSIYAKIKKGLLDSKTVDGKIYIILPDLQEEEASPSTQHNSNNPSHVVNIKELLHSKEETISVLKESIKDLKHTNTEINTTLRGEIELLKQVFTEMRNLYVKQVEYMGEHQLVQLNSAQTEQEVDPNGSDCWVDIETFLDRINIQKSKKRRKIKKAFLKAYQENDPRIKIETDTLFISCYDFYEDIL